MLPEYQKQYEEYLNNPYSKPFRTGFLPSAKLWNEWHDLKMEEYFYESIYKYYGQLRYDHEKKLDEAFRKADKQDAKETVIMAIVLAVLVLGFLILCFEFVLGCFIFVIIAVPFTAQALKNGGNV